jgi:cyclopropane-fatty-acyl-phospholipid synthase
MLAARLPLRWLEQKFSRQMRKEFCEMAHTYGNAPAVRNPGIESAKHILSRLFMDFDGSLRIGLWDGSEMLVGHEQPEFSLIFRSARAFQDMVLSHHPLRVVESYFRGGSTWMAI